MCYVYVLLSEKDGKRYIGSTSDIKQRFLEHQNGSVQATKGRRPLELIYYEGFPSKTDALREELFLKTGKGRERLKKLLSE